MSIEDVQPNGDDTDNTPQGEETATPLGDSQIEAQAEIDWKAQSRKWEAQAKREREKNRDLEERVKKAISPDDVAHKDEANAQLQREAEQAKLEALRFRVALAEGLPVEVAVRLQGQTEEEIREDAVALKSLIKTAPAGADAKKAVLKEAPPVKADPNDLLRQIIASR